MAVKFTAQLVGEFTPITAKLPSDQAPAEAPFHQSAVVPSQFPLPSCGPAPLAPASQASAVPAPGVVAHAAAPAPETATRFVATTV